MRILGCVLLHLPDGSPTASISGTCVIGGVRSTPRNEVLRAITIGLLPVSPVEFLLSPFRRIETLELPWDTPSTNPLPRAARVTHAVGAGQHTGSPVTRRGNSNRTATDAAGVTIAASDGSAVRRRGVFGAVLRSFRRPTSAVLLVTRASGRRERTGSSRCTSSVPDASPGARRGVGRKRVIADDRPVRVDFRYR